MKFLFLFFLISSFWSRPIDSDHESKSQEMSQKSDDGISLYDDSWDGNSLLIDNFFDFEEFTFPKNDVERAVLKIIKSGKKDLYYPKNNEEIDKIKGILKSDPSEAMHLLKTASTKTCNFILAWAVIFKQWDIMEFLLNKDGVDRSLMHALMDVLPHELKEYLHQKLSLPP